MSCGLMSCDAVWVLAVVAGYFSVPLASAIAFVFFALARASAMRLAARTLPLCGAAPTFLCRRKEK
ncbi:conserved hypothetical protein [Paraburkholderia piptadeniae]|uniref:Uncharacterized protein n=1 Tax=Paraburkholderia piptadeniae TaxID=1701573 RepID=A0A1N7RMF4_9BURK|nr:conserved hypothetical protein [Paraburkholderia piptadeniae]